MVKCMTQASQCKAAGLINSTGRVLLCTLGHSARGPRVLPSQVCSRCVSAQCKGGTLRPMGGTFGGTCSVILSSVCVLKAGTTGRSSVSCSPCDDDCSERISKQ